MDVVLLLVVGQPRLLQLHLLEVELLVVRLVRRGVLEREAPQEGRRCVLCQVLCEQLARDLVRVRVRVRERVSEGEGEGEDEGEGEGEGEGPRPWCSPERRQRRSPACRRCGRTS